MSHITPPSENKPGQPLQPAEPKPERKWFNEQEIEKLKPIARKFFKSQQDVPDDKINGMLKLVEGYIKKGENLPPEYEKTALVLFFRLARLGPEKWSHVMAAIYQDGIDSLDPKKLGDLIKKEESGQAPQQTASTSSKRALEEKAAVPPAGQVISPPKQGFLEKRPRKIEESGKGPEKGDQTSGIAREGPEIKLQPQDVTASPLSREALDEKFKSIFEKNFAPKLKVRNYSWDKLKSDSEAFGAQDKCKSRSHIYQACWHYLSIKDLKKLNLLLKHIEYLEFNRTIAPYLIVEAARALETASIQFPDLVTGLLTASIIEPNMIDAIQYIYKKLNLGLGNQENAIKIVELLKKYSIFNYPKWQELFELALSRMFSWIIDKESFLFAQWILECLLKNSPLPESHAENINSVFIKIEENQKEFYRTYSKSSPLEKAIYKNAIESHLLTISLQEIKQLPQIAKERFTLESVKEMMSDSIFRKHLYEIADYASVDLDKVKKVARERLGDRNLALSNGASVLMSTRADFINRLVEALQVNVVYVLQLERYARGEEKSPKWPVEKPTDSLSIPHLVNLLYEFKNEKPNKFIHQQSLNTQPIEKPWNAIEFGLVIRNQKLEIIHCCPIFSR